MERHIDYQNPVSLSSSQNVVNLSFLRSGETQNTIGMTRCTRVSGKGYILLDFGSELFGGIRLNFGPNSPMEGPNVRIRFGESLGEACSELGKKGSSNDHSLRDLCVDCPSHSDMTFGSTAFRFVRIDFLQDGVYYLQGAFAAFDYEVVPSLRFVSDDSSLNQIVDAALRTLQLNVHHGVIWDGAKRDQHVWAGDLFPACFAYLYGFSDPSPVKNSIDYILSHYPLPTWYHGIPSYNIWFSLMAEKYVQMTGDKDPRYVDSITQNLRLVASTIRNGEWKEFAKYYPDFDWGYLFFDWRSVPDKDRVNGIQALALYFANSCFHSSIVDEDGKRLASFILSSIHFPFIDSTHKKTVNAMMLMAGVGDKPKLIDSILEGGASGWSCFLSYFLMKALTIAGKGKEAYQIAKDYYQGMIDIGGTTLFEEHDPSWLLHSCRIDELPQEGQLDYHGDHGEECYVGFRRSLAHAWATGILPFLIEDVLGIHVHDNGAISFTKPIEGAPEDYSLRFFFHNQEIRIEKKNGEAPKVL